MERKKYFSFISLTRERGAHKEVVDVWIFYDGDDEKLSQKNGSQSRVFYDLLEELHLPPID